MPTRDRAAAAKWPDVPACYGWLGLDRHGGWRLKGDVVRHAGLRAFINRHYRADDAGNWIFQNGPQTVYVTLDYTPLVFRLDLDGNLTAHTGVAPGPVVAAYLDEEGSVLLHTGLGIGLLDDRDLSDFVLACRNARGEPAADAALLSAITGDADVFWRGLPVLAIQRRDVPARFGFRPAPAP